MEVTITMPYSEKNRAALDKYEELVKKHYPGARSRQVSKILSAISEVGMAREKFNIGWYKNSEKIKFR